MRFITTKTHALMDYVMGILLIVVPLFWLGSANVPQAAIWTPVVIGALMLMQSLITDYELSLANIIPMSGHLAMDAIAGVVLAASPWLFGFAETIWWPHLLLGLGEIGAAMTTHTQRTEPARPTTGAHVHT
jgi:hypothetical protein